MHRCVVAIVIGVCPCVVYAQQSLFQSSDGQSALYLQQSTAALNLGDSKASLGFTHHDNKPKSLVWGYELFATANKGVSSLFSSDKAKAPEGGGDFTLGTHFLATSPNDNCLDPIVEEELKEEARKHPGVIIPGNNEFKNQEDWGLIDIGYSYSTFYISSTPTSTTSVQKSLNKFRAMAAYNYFYGGHRAGGISAGAERRNNLADLSSVQFSTTVASGTGSSVAKTKTGYYGAYKEYIAVPVYTDLLIYLGKLRTPGFGNRIALDLLSRSDIAAPNRSSLGGLGLFFFKKGNATVPIGGVTGTYDGTKFQFSLTTGFTVSK